MRVLIIAFFITAMLTSIKTCSKIVSPNLGDLIVHVVEPISSNGILPTTWPLPGERSTKLEVVAAKGELEPASFVIRSPFVGKNRIDIEVDDLVGKNSSIDSSNVDIKIVKAWYQAGGAWTKHRIDKMESPKLVPELLLNDDSLIRVDNSTRTNFLRLSRGTNIQYIDIGSRDVTDRPIIHSIADFPVQDAASFQPFSLAKGENKQLWVTVKIPLDTLEGTYIGLLKIIDDGRLIGSLTLQVNVLPFVLREPKLEYSIYYRGKLDGGSGSISSEYKSETQLEAELTNMKLHGITNPTVYQRLYNKHDRSRREDMKSISLLKRYLQIRQDVGYSQRPLYFLGNTTGAPKDGKSVAILEQTVISVKSLAAAYGATGFYIYGIDEATGQQLIEQLYGWRRVHALGGKVFVAGNTRHFETVNGATDIIVFYGMPDSQEAEKWHSRNKKIFSYHNPQTGPENPALFRKNYGILLWQRDFDGAMPYAYQHSMGSIWNDFDHEKYRDHNFTYPTKNGVIDTLAWEGFREGVDDVRYIATLEYLVAMAKDSPEGWFREKAEIAEKFLRDLKERDLDNMKRIRSEIINEILRLLPGSMAIITSPNMQQK